MSKHLKRYRALSIHWWAAAIIIRGMWQRKPHNNEIYGGRRSAISSKLKKKRSKLHNNLTKCQRWDDPSGNVPTPSPPNPLEKRSLWIGMLLYTYHTPSQLTPPPPKKRVLSKPQVKQRSTSRSLLSPPLRSGKGLHDGCNKQRFMIKWNLGWPFGKDFIQLAASGHRWGRGGAPKTPSDVEGRLAGTL